MFFSILPLALALEMAFVATRHSLATVGAMRETVPA